MENFIYKSEGIHSPSLEERTPGAVCCPRACWDHALETLVGSGSSPEPVSITPSQRPRLSCLPDPCLLEQVTLWIHAWNSGERHWLAVCRRCGHHRNLHPEVWPVRRPEELGRLDKVSAVHSCLLSDLGCSYSHRTVFGTPLCWLLFCHTRWSQRRGRRIFLFLLLAVLAQCWL